MHIHIDPPSRDRQPDDSPPVDPQARGALLTVPAIHADLPPTCRLALTTSPAGSTPSGISLHVGGPASPRHVQSCAATLPPWSALIKHKHGVSLVSGDQAGIRVQVVENHDAGERFITDVAVAQRPPALPIAAAAEMLPLEIREAFLAAASPMFRGGDIPGEVAKRFAESCANLLLSNPAPADLQRFAARGLQEAVAQDGEALGLRQRSTCGRSTMEIRRLDPSGVVHRSFSRCYCGTQRCPRCGPYLSAHWRVRTCQQLLRDQANCRAWPVFFTLTVDPDRFVNAAEAHRLLNDLIVLFVKRLRAEFGDDLAYLVAVESHANGFPHVHVLVRSHALIAAMLAEVGVESVNSSLTLDDAIAGVPPQRCLIEVVTEARAHPDGHRHTCPYPALRRLLAQMAVESGFGTAGFYVAPALSLPAIAAELCKATQINPSMPRHCRRFRASGKTGDQHLSSFFCDETDAKPASEPLPVPTADPAAGDWEAYAGGHGRTSPTVAPIPGVPLTRKGWDVPIPAGTYLVRAEAVADVDDASGESRADLALLTLRIMAPASFSGATIRQRFSRSGIPADPIGLQGWLNYAPRGTKVNGRRLRFARADWVAAPAPGAVTARPGDPVPSAPVEWFEPGVAPKPSKDGRVLDVVLHHAPIEQVIKWHRDRGVAFVGPRYALAAEEPSFTGALVSSGTGPAAAMSEPVASALIRELQACSELARAPAGAAAVHDYLWWLADLQRFPPPGLDTTGIAATMQAVAQLYAALTREAA